MPEAAFGGPVRGSAYPSAARRQHIVERLLLNGAATTAELSHDLGVSAMTIRRDLAALERDGLVRRSHGGAIATAGHDADIGYRLRIMVHMAAKAAIAREAARLVQPGDCIFLDAGTTTAAMIPYLRGIPRLRVVTHAVNVAYGLGDLLGIAVTQIGGELYRASFAAVGPQAVEAVRRYHVDRFFLGVCGVHETAGLSNTNADEAEVKRAAIAVAGEVIVVTDASKFGRAAFAPIAPLQVAQRFVTDPGIPPEWVARLRGLGIDVLVATPTAPRRVPADGIAHTRAR